MDDDYLDGWKERKDIENYVATSGNIGMVDGPSREEIEKKSNEIKHLKEVWQRSKDVQLLKKNI